MLEKIYSNTPTIVKKAPYTIYKGLEKAVIKFTLINIPAYLLYFGSDTHSLPEGQEGKIIESAKGAIAMHIIQNVGTELIKEFMPNKKLEAFVHISGCVAQASITGKALVSGLIRGSAYEVFGMSYASVIITEGLYSGSNALISNFNNNNSISKEVLVDSLISAYKGAEAANYLYAAVQCSFLPLTASKIPDMTGAMLCYTFLPEVNISKVHNISKAIIPMLSIESDLIQGETENLFKAFFSDLY